MFPLASIALQNKELYLAFFEMISSTSQNTLSKVLEIFISKKLTSKTRICSILKGRQWANLNRLSVHRFGEIKFVFLLLA